MIVCLERFLTEAEERGNAFFMNLLEKQHIRLKGLFERRVVCLARMMVVLSLTNLLQDRAYQIRGRYEAHEQETQWS